MRSPLKSKTIKAVVIVTESAIFEEKNGKRKPQTLKPVTMVEIS